MEADSQIVNKHCSFLLLLTDNDLTSRAPLSWISLLSIPLLLCLTNYGVANTQIKASWLIGGLMSPQKAH